MDSSLTQMQRVQLLIEQVESFPSPNARDTLRECLGAVLEIYGAGLERIMELASTHPGLLDALGNDETVRGLLFIHGLHPASLEERLAGALDQVRPYLLSHGGDVELIECRHGLARLRLRGHCQTCPSSSATLDLAIRHAIEEACPDLDILEVEGLNAQTPRFPNAPVWHVLGREADLGSSPLQPMQINGDRVLLCRVGEHRYAYRNQCPACEADFDRGLLEQDTLSCPRGHRFNVRQAGISAQKENAEFHLEPFPLVAADGVLKIALRSIPHQEAA